MEISYFENLWIKGSWTEGKKNNERGYCNSLVKEWWVLMDSSGTRNEIEKNWHDNCTHLEKVVTSHREVAFINLFLLSWLNVNQARLQTVNFGVTSDGEASLPGKLAAGIKLSSNTFNKVSNLTTLGFFPHWKVSCSANSIHIILFRKSPTMDTLGFLSLYCNCCLGG